MAYTGYRLLSDKELADILPVGEQFDYVTANGRAEGRLGRTLYYVAEATLGTDLQDPGLFAAGSLGVAWRPHAAIELRLGGGYSGNALGRADADQGASVFNFGLTVRW